MQPAKVYVSALCTDVGGGHVVRSPGIYLDTSPPPRTPKTLFQSRRRRPRRPGCRRRLRRRRRGRRRRPRRRCVVVVAAGKSPRTMRGTQIQLGTDFANAATTNSRIYNDGRKD